MSVVVKKKKLTEAIESYTREVDKTLDLLADTLQVFFEGKPEEELDSLAHKVRKKEALCDSYRREIEAQLYSGAAFKTSRGDAFSLLEAFDKVPNKAEDVANYLAATAPLLPGAFNNDIEQILKLTLKCSRTLTSSVLRLFEDSKKAIQLTHSVETLETAIDKLERYCLKRVFGSSDIQTGEKILLRELVRGLCSISDRAEDAADRIKIIAIKLTN